jgi:hypothetical protein
VSEGAGLGRLTDPDPSRSGLTEPGGPVGSNGPKPICQIKFQISNLNAVFF